jgi:hypothetical protein
LILFFILGGLLNFLLIWLFGVAPFSCGRWSPLFLSVVNDCQDGSKLKFIRVCWGVSSFCVFVLRCMIVCRKTVAVLSGFGFCCSLITFRKLPLLPIYGVKNCLLIRNKYTKTNFKTRVEAAIKAICC